MILDYRVIDRGLETSTSGRTVTPAGSTYPTSGAVADVTMRVETTRFGTLETENDLIITLPEGLIGFEHCHRFLVVCQDENSAFRWLQSVEEPAVALPIIEPGAFRSDYAPTISDADGEFLGLTESIPTLVFVIVTVPSHSPSEMTANLLGPIVINGLTRRGKQVIVQDAIYTTRHKIVEELRRSEELCKKVA